MCFLHLGMKLLSNHYFFLSFVVSPLKNIRYFWLAGNLLKRLQLDVGQQFGTNAILCTPRGWTNVLRARLGNDIAERMLLEKDGRIDAEFI